ncbi:SOS response-associated peptidase [Allonocardiopsis opalescens]|uniref:Abasic site processing protein n=1 Tax=Allonocardiopsis opalescens TaxID=1144618 RepID=A0A2T0QDM0_9ACTN|nr:SOS response-associated peptidase [Allonocardiopsis opalescens]PRY02044.1 putative SOS response-associated peptidase YedK [Allonocardiopsis opalescens]
MCGRYALARTRGQLQMEFGAEWAVPEELTPDYNVAPTKRVYAVLERRVAPGAPPRRELRDLRWGLVPSWSKDSGGAAKMINARLESVAEKPAFRGALARRRCLVPVDGYYEWLVEGADRPRSQQRRHPYHVSFRGGRPLALAGLYELWRDPVRPDGDPDAWWRTCAIITTEANPEIRGIHHRMPMPVAPSVWDRWLDPALTDTDEVLGLLRPPPEGSLAAHRVGDAVNSVRNNDPSLLRPHQPEPEPEEAQLF